MIFKRELKEKLRFQIILDEFIENGPPQAQTRPSIMIRRHHPRGRAETGHEAVDSGDRERCDPPAVRQKSLNMMKKINS